VSPQRILQSIGWLNETMVQEVVCGVLSCLRHFYFHTSRSYIGISPSSVIYDYKNKKFKLCLSFSKKFSILDTHQDSLRGGELLAVYWQYRKKFWIDLFCLGILMMNCIFGECLDVINRLVGYSLNDLYDTENISRIPERSKQFCCLYHYTESILLKDEGLLRSKMSEYQRIYEIEDYEAVFVVIKKMKSLKVETKDFLCNLTHLDLRNPQDIKDILHHSFVEASMKTAKSSSPKQPTLREACKVIRHEQTSAKNTAGQEVFATVVEAIDLLHRHDRILLDEAAYGLRTKLLAKEMNIDKATVDRYFVERVDFVPATARPD